MNLVSPARTALATLPTPLTPALLLSERVGVEIWLKRDDLTGFGLGGNKVRTLEYLIGAAQARDCDSLVTGGGPRSNWTMLAALAATTVGMTAHLVYFGDPLEPEGNHLLAGTLPGVEIIFTGNPERGSVDPVLDSVADRLRHQGSRPYVVGRGGANPTGALGYLNAGNELEAQLESAGLDPTTIWLATGSCGTQAGLVAAQAGTHGTRVVGVSVHRPVEECRQRIEDIATGTLRLIGRDTGDLGEWEVIDGRKTTGASTAATLVATSEGVFLDPEFGAPAMAELIARSTTIKGPVVFLVSGGAPNLFTTRQTP